MWLILHYTYLVSDLDGDGNPEVLVPTQRYDPATDIDTSSIIAKKGIDGTQLWEKTVTASGKDNCDILAFPVGDLDGDELTDVIVTEIKYDETTNTTVARVIAKQGSTGTQMWEESVNATGKDNCDMDALPAGNLDSDELADVIVIESKYDGVTETARVIAKQGSNGTQMWEESVNAIGKDNCEGE